MTFPKHLSIKGKVEIGIEEHGNFAGPKYKIGKFLFFRRNELRESIQHIR